MTKVSSIRKKEENYNKLGKSRRLDTLHDWSIFGTSTRVFMSREQIAFSRVRSPLPSAQPLFLSQMRPLLLAAETAFLSPKSFVFFSFFVRTQRYQAGVLSKHRITTTFIYAKQNLGGKLMKISTWSFSNIQGNRVTLNLEFLHSGAHNTLH